MRHTRVADLMTDEVVSVTPAAPFKDIAKLLTQHDITGVPVLDPEDRVVGVVSQTDLLARRVAAADRSDGAPPTAADVMSAPAVTSHPEDSAADAARLMTRRGVERLPVVDEEDRLVGIVTRRDLLRVFLRPDAEIRRRIADEVLGDVLRGPAGNIDFHVVDGVVTLTGRVDRRSRLPVLVGLVERIDGVVAVLCHVTADTDDTAVGHARHAMPW
ncbi:CBS domain-containing protein [Streptomyces bambusae]|uniref:CBS domain-containing protein n=1 Tax=Streptomyces bambusae TaxID=1550616 RepID=UPI001CFDFB9A|nr:CBS domain-containing protein [Streptomyces bambusae]MCB5163874.1 CBS domain-containing protein [Streptomyces bambusae]